MILLFIKSINAKIQLKSKHAQVFKKLKNLLKEFKFKLGQTILRSTS